MYKREEEVEKRMREGKPFCKGFSPLALSLS